MSRIPLDHSRRRYCRIVRSQDESGGEKGGASGKSDAKTEEMVKGVVRDIALLASCECHALQTSTVFPME